MIIIASFEDFVSAVVHYRYNRAPKNWRTGQVAFNLLAHVRPDIADMVRGSDYDPFHNDGNLSGFYDFVMRNW